MATETFKQAHTRIVTTLRNAGWASSPAWTVPYLTSPDGRVRLWFKAQAIYYSRGNSHSLSGARSLCDDPRGVGADQIVHWAFT